MSKKAESAHLCSMPAVRLIFGSALTTSFGLACRGYTYDKSAFNVLFKKVWGLLLGFRSAVPKPFLIEYHLWALYFHRVPP